MWCCNYLFDKVKVKVSWKAEWILSDLHGKDDDQITRAASYGTTWYSSSSPSSQSQTSWLSSFRGFSWWEALSLTVLLSTDEISEYTWIDRLKHRNRKLVYLFIDQRVRRRLLKPSGGMCFGGGWNRRAMKAGGCNMWWGIGNMNSYTHSHVN